MSDERTRQDAPLDVGEPQRDARVPERPASAAATAHGTASLAASAHAALTPEEAAEVIREATRLQQRDAGAQLSRDEVVAMGKELGLSAASVEQALAKRSERAAAQALVRSEQRKFLEHLTWYAVTIGGLAGLDWFTGGGWWVQWPAMGWGIGLFFHAVALLQTRFWPPDAQALAARRQARAERRAARRALRAQRHL